MALHGDQTVAPRVSSDSLKRTKSDITCELIKELDVKLVLPPVSEADHEDAKCECCGMREECTPEYVKKVCDKFMGKWICGLCAEAVKEELEKNGYKKEKALSAHMSACVRFNKYGRAYPVLSQAEAMREMLKKSQMEGTSMRPKKGGGGIARTSSCIPAITREISNLTIAN